MTGKCVRFRRPASVFRRPSHLVRASAGKASPLEPPNVERLAEMARIDVTPTEVQDWSPKIAAIVDWWASFIPTHFERVLVPPYCISTVAGASLSKQHSLLAGISAASRALNATECAQRCGCPFRLSRGFACGARRPQRGPAQVRAAAGCGPGWHPASAARQRGLRSHAAGRGAGLRGQARRPPASAPPRRLLSAISLWLALCRGSMCCDEGEPGELRNAHMHPVRI